MNSTLRKDKNELYQPTFPFRLLYWFGIYLCGALPIALLTMSPGPLLGFPWGLFFAINFFKATFIPESMILVIYGIYVVHLFISLFIPSFRIFHFLKFVLIVVVTINLLGCIALIHSASQLRIYEFLLAK